MNAHVSLPIGTSALALVQSPGVSNNTQAAIQFGLTFLGLQQPYPIVNVPDQLAPDVANATAVTAQLTLGGIVGAPVYYTPAGYTAGQTVVFAAQVGLLQGSPPTVKAAMIRGGDRVTLRICRRPRRRGHSQRGQILL